MGVKYLNAYCWNIRAFEKVNLFEEIRDERLRTGKRPVLVIDGVSLLYNLKRSLKLTWLTGGSLTFFERIMRKFLQKLRTNAEVIVFFDGVNSTGNSETWINRRMHDVKMNHIIFDMLNRKLTINQIEKINYDKLFPCIWEVVMSLYSQLDCKIVKAVYDNDAELSAFVRDNKCLGIIADDSDFFINCSCNIYTCYNVQEGIYSGEFVKRRRDIFLNHVRLNDELLPLLASLLGNDVTSPDVRVNNNKNADRIMDEIVDYIKYLNINGNITADMLKRISLEIYNDPRKAELLKKSIDSYCVRSETIEVYLKKELLGGGDPKWTEILTRALKYHKHTGGTGHIFTIMAKNIFEKSTCVEDFREKDFPPLQLVLRPLRQKIYGLLLFEKPGETLVKEVIVDNDCEITPVHVKPIWPQVFHPGLIALWDMKNVAYNWALLGDALEVDSVKVQIIPQPIAVPALVMKYLKTLPSNYLDGNLFHLIFNTMGVGVPAEKILELGFGCFLGLEKGDCEKTFNHILNFIFED